MVAGTGHHLIQKNSPYRWILLGAICWWLVCTVFLGLRALVAYLPWKSPSTAVRLSAADGILWMDLSIKSNRRFSPGQYIYLWFPLAGWRALTQHVLCYVSVCEFEGPKEKWNIHMVVRPQRRLNRALYHLYRLQQTQKAFRRQPVAVFGPYGRSLELSCYGTIIFALEDIGLFRALPYIEMLLRASCQRRAMVRRVEVLWKRERPFRKSGEVDERFMGELTI
jgi:hypothetical protein